MCIDTFRMLRLLVLSGLVAFAFAQTQCRDSDAPNWEHSYDCCDGGDCRKGEGDCDKNQNHCRGDLVCGGDNCQYMNPGDGYPGDSDCCYEPCRGERGWDFSYNCCVEGGDCGEGEGDCDNHGECSGNLRCGKDNCRYMNPGEGKFPNDADCCYQPCRGEPGWSFSYSCCAEGGDCGMGEGDCDNDGECRGNLVCGNNNCRDMNPGEGYPADADCCTSG